MGCDAIVLGAGHNGLVAATLLARAGRRVTVLEARERLGGACVTERPFARAPGLGASTGAYLLGPMPPELIRLLGLRLPLVRRDPHYFLPSEREGHLLLGADAGANARALAERFSPQDAEADRRLGEEVAAIREDLAPSWLEPPRSLEETVERHVRPALRPVASALCRGSVAAYLERFGFRSDLLLAMYAVTDGLPGVTGGRASPGTGMNFLVHNMCRLPGAGGTWMLVRGGMGTVTAALAGAARAAGCTIRAGAAVSRIRVRAGAVEGVTLAGGEEVDAPVVVSGADPFTTLDLLGAAAPAPYRERIAALARPGTTMKLNLALRALPRFRCLPDDPRTAGPTIHLLAPEGQALAAVDRAQAEAEAGRLPDLPPIEWYLHTGLDPSLRDERGRHSGALFVQGVPHRPEGGWDRHRDAYARRLLAICDRFAPGTSDLVEDLDVLAPPDIEARFGIRAGHIHHVDNAFAFDRRAPYETPVAGLWLCGAGCHPAGSVIGAAGHNAARMVLTA